MKQNYTILIKKIVYYLYRKKVLSLFESIRRGNFAIYLFLGVWSPGKSYLFLKKFRESFGKLELFLWYFFLLENHMCSNKILDKIFWKIRSVLKIFFSLRKYYVFLQNFEKLSSKIYMCSFTVFGSPGIFDVFL